MPKTKSKKSSPETKTATKTRNCFGRLTAKLDKWLLLSVFIGCALTMPFNGVPAASEVWKFLFGNKYFGVINWCGSIPAPFVVLLMVKIEHLVSIKKRLLGCWIGGLLTLSALVGVSSYYFSNRLSVRFALIISMFCLVVICNAVLFAVSQASFFSFL